MPTYVTLVSYTAQGVAKMKESPVRLVKAREVFKMMGCELKSFYLSMGQYDAVVISEGPDDASVMKAAITVAGAGAIRTETMRVFTEPEYKDICAGLP
jgi:uncharacterized protein with GYD domain